MRFSYHQAVEKRTSLAILFVVDVQTDAGRHQLYNNVSLVLFSTYHIPLVTLLIFFLDCTGFITRLQNLVVRSGEFRICKLIVFTYPGQISATNSQISQNLSPSHPSLVVSSHFKPCCVKLCSEQHLNHT